MDDLAGRTELGSIDEADLQELLVVARRFGEMFMRGVEPDGSEPIPLHPGRDSWLIATEPRYAAEAQVIDVVPVSFPRAGLVVSVRHWSVPPRAVLHVFLPARGKGLSLLEDLAGGSPAPPGPPWNGRHMMVDSLLWESLATRLFYDHWVEVTTGSYYVPVQEDDYPPLKLTEKPPPQVLFPRSRNPQFAFPRPIGESERRELGRSAQRLRDQLEAVFERERESYGSDPVPLPPGPDSWLIATESRYAAEGTVVEIVPVSFPRIGLSAGIRHASLPPRAVLHVFVPARGGGHVDAIFAQRLAERTFYDQWVQVGPQTYYAPLHADDYPPAATCREFSDAELRHIYNLVVDHDPRRRGFERALWEQATIRELIRLEFGVSCAYLGILLDGLGLAARWPKRSPASDPEAFDRWRDVELPALRTRAAETGAALYFCYTGDPLSRMQLPPRARLPRVTPSWAGQGITLLCASRSPNDQASFAAYHGPETPEVFLDFCERLVHDVHGPLVLVTDPSPSRRYATTTRQFHIASDNRLTVAFRPGQTRFRE